MAQRLAADFGRSIGAAGYQRLAGGLILQWGSVAITGAGASWQSGLITFPIAFPNASLSAVAGSNSLYQGGNLDSGIGPSDVVAIAEYTKTGCRWRLDTNGAAVLSGSHVIRWIAIGH